MSVQPRYTLAELYAQRSAVWSDIVEHLPTLYNTVIDGGAQTVVELGVRTGNSTAALLAGVEQTGGHLWSVDVRLMPGQFYAPLKRAADGRWTFVLGNDLEVADQVGWRIETTTISDPEPSYVPGGIDVLFIDSSHYYEHTLAELNLYGPRARTILLHDTELAEPDGMPATDPKYPVRKAVDDWIAKTGRPVEFHTNCYGLGIIRSE